MDRVNLIRAVDKKRTTYAVAQRFQQSAVRTLLVTAVRLPATLGLTACVSAFSVRPPNPSQRGLLRGRGTELLAKAPSSCGSRGKPKSSEYRRQPSSACVLHHTAVRFAPAATYH